MKFLINASNLHCGGGVQVATSFFLDLIELKLDLSKFSVLISSEVYGNLPKEYPEKDFYSFEVFNVNGFSFLNKDEKKKFSGFDVCFTVFGPVYFKIDAKKHICGFAQPWIAYPNTLAYKKLTKFNAIKERLKFKIQKIFFKKYDVLIVEADHIKKSLINLGFKNKIITVSNTTSLIFDNKDVWERIRNMPDMDRQNNTLGFIGRAYPHKNLAILKSVNMILKSKYKFECNFLFTLTNNEMRDCGFLDESNFFTVGSLSLNECPNFYENIDGLIFPSLLECFSATPIEAMKMGKPVFASDLPFVRDFCKDSIFYFDPNSAEDIARSIYEGFKDDYLLTTNVLSAKYIADSLPSSEDRAKKYISIITTK